MAITVTNQQPSMLNSHYTSALANDFDPAQTLMDNVVKPLLTPLITTQPVMIDEDGQIINEKDILNLLFDCSQDAYNSQAEDKLKEIFKQTMLFYNSTSTSLTAQDIYANQAGMRLNMPLPNDDAKRGPMVQYQPSDIIQAAMQLMANQIQPDCFFATLAYYSRIQSLGFYFANDAAWTDFKTWFNNELQLIAPVLPQETMNLCNQILGMRLNHLTESFVLRDDDTQNNEPYSFARVFVFYLNMYQQYTQQQGKPGYITGQLPFSFGETCCPRTIILVNLEKHAHATPNQIKNEWDIIKASMTMKPRVINSQQLTKLAAVARMAQKMGASTGMRKSSMLARSAVIKFRKTPPTSIDLYKYIMKIYKNTQFIQNSENTIKSKKMTYQRASRRFPDDPDRMGVATSIKYKPDLHLYIDCSGSISEREYQDAIKACIKLAIKMNVNLYFNSFSHIMSTTTKLHVKDHTPKQIYNEFKNTPKVGGGTDYEQIWHFINRSEKLGKEVSIIISDFEYWAPNHFVKHPRFLYYAPISTSNWKGITQAAEGFAKSMLSICPGIRKHILM